MEDDDGTLKLMDPEAGTNDPMDPEDDAGPLNPSRLQTNYPHESGSSGSRYETHQIPNVPSSSSTSSRPTGFEAKSKEKRHLGDVFESWRKKQQNVTSTGPDRKRMDGSGTGGVGVGGEQDIPLNRLRDNVPLYGLFSRQESSFDPMGSSCRMSSNAGYHNDTEDNPDPSTGTGKGQHPPLTQAQNSWKPLSLMEKKYLIAVERGDLASVRRFLEQPTSVSFSVNCCDPVGRSALLMAIDNENLEMIELLIAYGVEMKDALLHAINEEFVEAVELLLDHEESLHHTGSPWSWEAVERETFTSDVTPLILAAHKNNYEIIKLLLDRGISTIPSPHDARCGCKSCRQSRTADHLRHSRSRINAYRALASPCLIALSSKDPILTAFELSWQLRRLSFLEPEFKTEYMELRKQCQHFGTALLDHTRTTHELEVLLNHDPGLDSNNTHGKMTLSRLKLAIRCKQKKFCAHANVQQLLASIWYEGLPGFRRKNIVVQTLQILFIGFLFPILSIAYILAPCTRIGQVMKKPFIKFICHSASYMTFLVLLALASQRIETDIFDFSKTAGATKRGAPPTLIELLVLPWVLGLIWSEIKQLWELGLADYLSDMWNILDFITNSLYVATITLRVIAFLQVQKEIIENTGTANFSRESWDAFDPILLAEGLFAAANIFSSLKLVYIFSVNPHLGPLQISLGRMVIDILKFFSVYTLVCFAFACGMNQLLWYYADMERQVCIVQSKLLQNNSHWNASVPNVSGPIISFGGKRMYMPKSANEACIAYRKFSNLFESLQTLFWATFGLIDLENFELTGIQSYTRFWGMTMFGCYCIINVTVLLNLLIAMMNHSYQIISEQADTEWKFARTKLWMSYFEDGGTVPIPFNIIPTPKSFIYLFKWFIKKFFSRTTFAKNEAIKTIRRKARQASERDHRYQNVMRSLVRRYITNEQRTAERQRGVTEDDCNEIKQDISALRFELIELLGGRNGHRLLNRHDPLSAFGDQTSSLSIVGKRGRKKERRLMKGFDFNFLFMDTVTSVDEPDLLSQDLHLGPHSGSKGNIKSPTSRNKFVRLARGLAGKRGTRANKWKQLIEATRSKVIPFSRSTESVNSIGQMREPNVPEGDETEEDMTTGTRDDNVSCSLQTSHLPDPQSPTPMPPLPSCASSTPASALCSPRETGDTSHLHYTSPQSTSVSGSTMRHPHAHHHHHPHFKLPSPSRPLGTHHPMMSQPPAHFDPTQRRFSNKDFDAPTKRSLFARKATSLAKEIEMKSTFGPKSSTTCESGGSCLSEEPMTPLGLNCRTGGGGEVKNRIPSPLSENPLTKSPSPQMKERVGGCIRSSTPRLLVTVPPTSPTDEGGQSPTLPFEENGKKLRTKHHHNRHRRKSNPSPRSRSRSRSKSPSSGVRSSPSHSKSPSPQSLNASVLFGLTQVRRPRNEWI